MNQLRLAAIIAIGTSIPSIAAADRSEFYAPELRTQYTTTPKGYNQPRTYSQQLEQNAPLTRNGQQAVDINKIVEETAKKAALGTTMKQKDVLSTMEKRFTHQQVQAVKGSANIMKEMKQQIIATETVLINERVSTLQSDSARNEVRYKDILTQLKKLDDELASIDKNIENENTSFLDRKEQHAKRIGMLNTQKESAREKIYRLRTELATYQIQLDSIKAEIQRLKHQNEKLSLTNEIFSNKVAAMKKSLIGTINTQAEGMRRDYDLPKERLVTLDYVDEKRVAKSDVGNSNIYTPSTEDNQKKYVPVQTKKTHNRYLKKVSTKTTKKAQRGASQSLKKKGKPNWVTAFVFDNVTDMEIMVNYLRVKKVKDRYEYRDKKKGKYVIYLGAFYNEADAKRHQKALTKIVRSTPIVKKRPII